MWLYNLLCPPVGWLVTLYFFMILFLWPHCSCPNGLMTSNMAPAHPHATSVAVYPSPIPSPTHKFCSCPSFSPSFTQISVSFITKPMIWYHTGIRKLCFYDTPLTLAKVILLMEIRWAFQWCIVQSLKPNSQFYMFLRASSERPWKQPLMKDHNRDEI